MKKTPILFRSPDAANGSGSGTPVPSPTPSPSPTKTRTTPRADADLGTVADRAANKWIATSNFTLLWMTASQFRDLVNTYLNGIQERKDASGQRPNTTLSLTTLEDSIEAGAAEVKSYIKYKFKQAAIAQYPRYGLVHHGYSWEMPADRDDLKNALESMKNAINADGFANEAYGKSYWSDAQSQFDKLFGQAKDIDGSISGTASQKNTDKATVRQVLKALHHLIEANYPDTYAAVAREWGWQKEDY